MADCLRHERVKKKKCTYVAIASRMIGRLHFTSNKVEHEELQRRRKLLKSKPGNKSDANWCIASAANDKLCWEGAVQPPLVLWKIIVLLESLSLSKIKTPFVIVTSPSVAKSKPPLRSRTNNRHKGSPDVAWILVFKAVQGLDYITHTKMDQN